MKPNEVVDNILFVEYGIVEIYTEFESNEFVIEKLYKGSSINFMSFIIEDIS
jgi:hypothetical protein